MLSIFKENFDLLVGAVRFELTTPWSQTKCATAALRPGPKIKSFRLIPRYKRECRLMLDPNGAKNHFNSISVLKPQGLVSKPARDD